MSLNVLWSFENRKFFNRLWKARSSEVVPHFVLWCPWLVLQLSQVKMPRTFPQPQQDGAETTDYEYDLFVIGAGSGGVRASRTSAGFGAKVCAQVFAIAYSTCTCNISSTPVLRFFERCF